MGTLDFVFLFKFFMLSFSLSGGDDGGHGMCVLNILHDKSLFVLVSRVPQAILLLFFRS